MHQLIAIAAAAVVTLIGSNHSHAEEWPTRAVRIIAPHSAGGGADTVARLVAQHLTETLHQGFVVENRTGATGMVGSGIVARADPDGYTFLVGGMPSHVIGPASRPNPPYDPVKDFTSVAYVGGAPLVICANPSLGVKSFKELIALAKTQTINYGTPGIGSIGNLLGANLAQEAKIKLQNIPYRGGSKVVTDLLAGNIKLGITSLTPVEGFIRAGKLVPLVVSSAKRVANHPTVPTFKELGYEDMVVIAWWQVFGPAKLPKDIAHKMHDAVNKAIETPEIRGRLEHLNMIIEPMSEADAEQMVARQYKKWKPIVQEVFAARQNKK